MDSTLDYLIKKHATLINDYRTPDGQYNEHCLLIAFEIAQRLLIEGKSPRIEKIAEDIVDGVSVRPKNLIPLVFKGKWQDGWRAHQICCAGDMAFEPLLGYPIPIKDYCKEMFGEDIRMTTSITPAMMRALQN